MRRFSIVSPYKLGPCLPPGGGTFGLHHVLASLPQTQRAIPCNRLRLLGSAHTAHMLRVGKLTEDTKTELRRQGLLKLR